MLKSIGSNKIQKQEGSEAGESYVLIDTKTRVKTTLLGAGSKNDVSQKLCPYITHNSVLSHLLVKYAP